MTENAGVTDVYHLLDPMMGATGTVWGKERIVQALMLAQRARGEVRPHLVCIAPGRVAELLAADGFDVHVLDDRSRRYPRRAFPALVRTLARTPGAVLHTHGYKANVLGRAARALGAPLGALVSTCHAWFDESAMVRFYNELDRRTAFASDLTTVADAKMLQRFPRGGRLAYVANGIPDEAAADVGKREEWASARAAFGFAADRFVVGTLSRTDAAKGTLDVLSAAQRTRHRLDILWAVAGSGELAERVRTEATSADNLRYLGHLEQTERYRSALDAYLQASYVEGLSLSLLEAMRAGLPIVATTAGSTAHAIRDRVDGLLIEPGNVPALVAAVLRLADDRAAAAAYGASARARFASDFVAARMERDYAEIYRAARARRARRARTRGAR